MIYVFQVNNHVEIPSHMWIGAWMRPKLHLSLPSVPLNRQTLEVCPQLYAQHGPLFYSTTFVILFDYFSDTILSQIIMESQENGGNHYILVTPSCMHKKDIFFYLCAKLKHRKRFSLAQIQIRNVDPHPLSSALQEIENDRDTIIQYRTLYQIQPNFFFQQKYQTFHTHMLSCNCTV